MVKGRKASAIHSKYNPKKNCGKQKKRRMKRRSESCDVKKITNSNIYRFEFSQKFYGVLVVFTVAAFSYFPASALLIFFI